MLNITGIPSKEMIHAKFPSQASLQKPKAIIECYEDIPCNPCETSCLFKAISIGNDINSQPTLNSDLCTGCGICVYNCPGLAIIVAQIMPESARFKIPYEFVPVPVEGEIWHGLDRSGKNICEAKIVKVQQTIKQDKTILVTVDVDKKQIYDFITIRCPYE